MKHQRIDYPKKTDAAQKSFARSSYENEQVNVLLIRGH